MDDSSDDEKTKRYKIRQMFKPPKNRENRRKSLVNEVSNNIYQYISKPKSIKREGNFGLVTYVNKDPRNAL